jgi:hypothetical protein
MAAVGAPTDRSLLAFRLRGLTWASGSWFGAAGSPGKGRGAVAWLASVPDPGTVLPYAERRFTVEVRTWTAARRLARNDPRRPLVTTHIGSGFPPNAR